MAPRDFAAKPELTALSQNTAARYYFTTFAPRDRRAMMAAQTFGADLVLNFGTPRDQGGSS
jgi:hypothetical protein